MSTSLSSPPLSHPPSFLSISPPLSFCSEGGSAAVLCETRWLQQLTRRRPCEGGCSPATLHDCAHLPPSPPHTQSVAIVRYVNNSDNLLRVEAPNGLKHDSRWKMNQRVSNLVSFRVVAMLTPSSSIHLVSTPSSLMSRAGSGRLHRARPTPHHLLSSPPLNSRRRPG